VHEEMSKEANSNIIQIEDCIDGSVLSFDRLRGVELQESKASRQNHAMRGYAARIYTKKLFLVQAVGGGLQVFYGGKSVAIDSSTTFRWHRSLLGDTLEIKRNDTEKLSLSRYTPLELLMLPWRLVKQGVLPEENGAIDLLAEIQYCIENGGKSALPHLN
jgi:hypothetical protein